MEDFKVNFFLAGFQKCGSTWLHLCLSEHPEIYVPPNDTIHYFTVNSHKSVDWYHNFYTKSAGSKVLVDATPSYARQTGVAKRIHSYNPKAKILFCVRNPIDRAFSHYWHKKRKKSITYNFDDTLLYRGVGNYDLYSDFVMPGFYHELIAPWIEIFGKNQVKVVFFDDLRKSSSAFLEEIFKFIEVDSDFKPSMVDQKVNAANSLHKSSLKEIAVKVLNGIKSPFFKDEYKAGMSTRMREELRKLYSDDISKLASLTGRDLSNWK